MLSIMALGATFLNTPPLARWATLGVARASHPAPMGAYTTVREIPVEDRFPRERRARRVREINDPYSRSSRLIGSCGRTRILTSTREPRRFKIAINRSAVNLARSAFRTREKSAAATHRVKVALTPADRGGQDLLIGDTGAR